jgi:glycosyltransferase involved in cell wall biosynthesis
MLLTHINTNETSKEILHHISGPKPFVSIVVPGFNEEALVEKNLKAICEYMRSLENRFKWELVFVNDGSTDQTGDIADRFAQNHNNILILHHPYNFRLGQALRYAFSRCKGDYIIVLDLDLSYSPDHIERLLDKIIQTRAKIVIASPYMQGGKVSNVPWLRKMLSKWANCYLCLTAAKDPFSDKLTTITGMVRAYDRIFLSRLHLKAMSVEINAEIINKAKILRARIVEIPAHLNWQVEKNSKKKSGSRKSSMRLLSAMLQSLVSGFMFRPFLFFILPGMLLSLVSLYPIFWAIMHSIHNYRALAASSSSFDFQFSDAIGAAFQQSPHAFVVGGFALIIGIQLFSLGLMALQKKRYFDELFSLCSTTRMCSQDIYKITSRNEII